MAHETYSTSDLSRRSGDVISEALRRPVTITQRRKPRLVLLSIEDYERLLSGRSQRSGTLESMSDELLEEVEEAIAVYAEEAEDR
ncbi:type II toxin-antitoxin system prevent-host-death family antitoxin [Jiella endophytica]|uniref:Antitoxin n=1 Tax=Jiella endophytica TaxID=2558362 RepID=A0A4Y8R989_9HYPH|nr:type II toxin-antitoxin system prevent-host-death family antitoxin [Jiella endophytica]TFF17785.1 type II toxin-antitoxin system prevent-host-death family antitoxin [Jiella endophytica]